MRQRVPKALLLLGMSYIGTAAQIKDNAVTLTMAQVQARMDAYLNAVKNGTEEMNGLPPDTEPSACALACGWLDNELPGLISFPDSQEYSLLGAGYWTTQQAETRPMCRFSPTSAVDVSTGLLALRVAECQFAVKSGGHSIAAGTSSIDNGVAIHMGDINQITLSEDESQLSVGSGNRCVNVYSFLDGTGLTVIGGRVAGVGVGGFTLGGGIVLADGSIRDVTEDSDPDLFFALRGGGNNFGIITRIDFITYPQGDFFVGARTFEYDSATEEALNEALVNLNINGATDLLRTNTIMVATTGLQGRHHGIMTGRRTNHRTAHATASEPE